MDMCVYKPVYIYIYFFFLHPPEKPMISPPKTLFRAVFVADAKHVPIGPYFA